jgi:hypothetical protein
LLEYVALREPRIKFAFAAVKFTVFDVEYVGAEAEIELTCEPVPLLSRHPVKVFPERLNVVGSAASSQSLQSDTAVGFQINSVIAVVISTQGGRIRASA